MTEQRNLSDAVEPTVAAVVCLPVRRTTGGMDGMKLLSVATVIWLIASAIAGVPGAVCILILILLLTLAGLGFLKLRKRSITRYETTVNEALHRDLHSNLRISYFRASLLRAGQLIRLQDGSQSFTIIMGSLAAGSPTGADTQVTITAMHGDLGLSAFNDMVRAVIGR